MAHSLHRMIQLLTEALREPLRRKQLVAEFQSLVWAGFDAEIPEDIRVVLRELAYDLDFFEAAPNIRREDETLYGQKRLETEIREALAKLRAAGVVVTEV